MIRLQWRVRRWVVLHMPGWMLFLPWPQRRQDNRPAPRGEFFVIPPRTEH